MRAPITLRPLVALDSAAARALAHGALGDAPYADQMLAPLDGALEFESDEYRGIVAHEGGALVGVIVFGETAGAVGAGRIYSILVHPSMRRRGIATALIEAASADLRSRGARFVAIEVPEEPGLDAAHAVARKAGFRPEGRVSDFVREGVGLVFLRHDLVEPHDAT